MHFSTISYGNIRKCCIFAPYYNKTHAYDARKYTWKHPSSSLTIDDEWDGETFIEY